MILSNTLPQTFNSLKTWSLNKRRESVLTVWHSAYLWNKYVDKNEVWNIILRCPM